jgi:hypothetical protein
MLLALLQISLQCTTHDKILYRLQINIFICRKKGRHVQWNLGCRTTLISNKSVPEHKTKTKKNASVSEQNFGSRTGKLATRYVRCTAGERQLRRSLRSVQPPALYFIYLLCLFFLFKILCIFIVFVYDFMHEVLL